MQQIEDIHDVNVFNFSAMDALFDSPTTSISLCDPPQLEAGHTRTHHHHHVRSVSSESATSLVDGCVSTPVGTHLSLPLDCLQPPVTRPRNSSQSRPTSTVPVSSQARKPYSRTSNTRKREYHTISDEDDQSDELEPLDPNATEEQKLDYKRLKNKLAARRSRAKKDMEIHTMREENQRLRMENAVWKERAMMMERILQNHGVSFPKLTEP